MRAFAVAAVAAPCCLALDNGFDRPPMGWSGLYGAPFGQVNETIMVRAAQGLNVSGLLAKGYEYITIDDWWATRDPATGDIMGVPDKFPSGMKAVGQAIHAAGAKFGVYSAASERTCGNYSASLFNEKRDAHTLAIEWEIDYLKYDACIYSFGVAGRARYEAMSRALNATGRKVFYSVEGWSPSDGDWGPEVANMWRTGTDIWPIWDTCILHNLYQTNRAAQYNRYTMAAAGTLADHSGGGFNDGDMLQPPGDSLISVRKPGLTSTEAASQFKLWVIMKAPLILGVNWAQLSALPTLDPAYFGLVTNDEMLAINQDPSPQATLVSQAPSQAQQQAQAKEQLNITIQSCDLSRIDQRFELHPTSKAIKSSAGNLCVSAEKEQQGSGGFGLVAKPCGRVGDSFTLQQDEELTLTKVLTGPAKGLCLSETAVQATQSKEGGAIKGALSVQKCGIETPIDHDSTTDPIPISGFDHIQINRQIFLWDAKSGQIITGGSGNCLTLGMPNLGQGTRNSPGVPGAFTNNGTLQHEVWQGPLTAVAATGAQRQVVALLNKGESTEKIVARSATFNSGRVATAWKVRDVVAGKDMPPLAAGANLTAMVPSHGVAVFVLTQQHGPKVEL